MKFFVETLGCKVNLWESISLKLGLEEEGWVEDKGNPDVIVLNTCAVTSRASYQSRQVFRRLKRKFPRAKIIVTGCDASFEGEMYKKECADLVVPQGRKSELPGVILGKKKSLSPILEDFPGRTRAYVKIEDGCDRYCNYCVIPYLRGGVRSLEKDLVLEQVKIFLERGFKEIVLVGINLGLYGKDIYGRQSLTELLKHILENTPEGYRIRLSSIEPDLFPFELLDLLDDGRLCRHFHIPLQGMTNGILRAMGRRYSIEDFRELILRIKSKDNMITIGTDIIVGYPGEGNLFDEGLRNIEEIPFDYAHVFPFSPRKWTKAPKRIEGNMKSKVREVMEVVEEKRKKHLEGHIGKKLTILTEKENLGLSDNYIKVTLQENLKVNTFVDVKVEGLADNRTLIGSRA